MSHWGVTADAPWGDYGSILSHGMARARVDGRLQLARTGPFVAPLTLPGIANVVVTDALRHQLEASPMTGCRFEPIDVVHVTKVDWTTWPTDTEHPPVLPRDAEPEGYLLDALHDPVTAAALGLLWELVPDVYGRSVAKRTSRTPRAYSFALELEAAPAPDFFRSQTNRRLMVSDRAQALLRPICAEALQFHPALVRPLTDEDFAREPTSLNAGEPVPEGYDVYREGVNPFTGQPMRLIRRKS